MGALPPDGIDVAAERARTPGCGTGHHFNAAGAALLSAETLGTVVRHLELETRIGGYEAAQEAAPRLAAVYDLAGSLIGARGEEIALMESATSAWQRAVGALRLRPGDRVLAARSSYVSSALHLLALERERGIAVEVLPNGPDGAVDVDALERALDAGPAALVTAAHMPTSSGLVEPAAEIGARTRVRGVPFLLDATQSLGQLVVDVRVIGCDLLVGTGRKFLRGPRGTGLLYVAAALLDRMEPPAPDVRGAEWTGERSWRLAPGARRFETWEAAHALRLGLGAALADVHALGVERIGRWLGAAGRRLRDALGAVPGVSIADPPAARGAVITFTVAGKPPGQVKAELAARGVHLVSVPASHGRWDMDPRNLPAVVRASVHVYNDDADTEALIEAVRETAAPSRRRAVVETPPSPRVDESVDAVVVGLGAHGSAALHHLARRGFRVIGLERFQLGHDRGSSHGATRMIRRAYPSPVWDPLIAAAYAGWAELEHLSGERLVTTTGGLYAHAGTGAGGGLRGPGCVSVDHVRAAEIAPGLALPAGFRAVHDPGAGIIDAPAALRVQVELARAAGAQVCEREPVVEWAADGAGVIVHTPRRTIRADRLVLCAGPWLARLVPELGEALRVVRIVNAYFKADPKGPLGIDGLCCFSVSLPEGLVYGFPALDGRGVKLGLDPTPEAEELCAPDAPRRPATAPELSTLTSAAARFLPGAGPMTTQFTCLYTMTPDKRFAIGPLPTTPQVVLASPCSGHGFKFAPAIGAALADIASGVPRPDLAFLTPERLLSGPIR